MCALDKVASTAAKQWRHFSAINSAEMLIEPYLVWIQFVFLFCFVAGAMNVIRALAKSSSIYASIDLDIFINIKPI